MTSTHEERKNLIRQIEVKRASRVLTYITSDRANLHAPISGDVVSILHEHILRFAPAERRKIDLVIYSRGGDSDVPWSVVSMFREYCESGSFSVLIPYRAHSAATVIALGADEIVMTRKAELGPIDITIQSGPYNPTEGENRQRLPVSVEDVMGYFALLERMGCARPNEMLRGFESLAEKVHPLVLGTVSRLLEQTELVALRLLGTRAHAFTEEQNREIVKRLSSEIYSHRHTISRSEAMNSLGLRQIVKAEDCGVADELWELYKAYRELFLWDEPFQPEQYLIANNLDEYAWPQQNLACIESADGLDLCQKDVRVRRLRQVPPQVTLNVNNLSFPVVNMPALPSGITPEQVAQLIQQLLPSIIRPVIDTAAQEVASRFMATLPVAQFERVEYNGGWRKDPGGQ